MKPLVAIPDDLADRPFTLAEALERGITARMLRGQRFRRLTAEVYVCRRVALSHEVLARTACLAMPWAVLSHASAAAVLGLPLGLGEPEPRRVHVTVAPAQRGSRRSLVVVRRRLLPADQVVATPAGPATSAARTFVDRAAELELADLVALGDAMIRRQLTTSVELAAAVDRAHGGRGVRLARRALPLLDGRAASPMESRCRVVLVLGGCPPPEVNAAIHDADGCWIATGDLVWRRAKLVVEYDGRVHLTERQRRADLARRNDLVLEGWTVLQVSADDVLKRSDQLVARVRQLLAQGVAA